MDQLTSEINRIQSTTQFNTMNLLDGSFSSKNLQVGALSGQTIKISVTKMSASNIGVSGLSVSSNVKAGEAMSKIQLAIQSVSSQRSSLVLFRTDLSTLLTTLIQQVRIHQQLNHVSVIQIWHLRWLSTARTTSFSRLDSLCLHRLISRTRVFFHFSANHCHYYKKRGRFIRPLFVMNINATILIMY